MKRADYHFPTSRIPTAELERLALVAYRDGRNYDWFHRRHWKAISKAAGGRRKPDLGTLVERIVKILETGKIPPETTADIESCGPAQKAPAMGPAAAGVLPDSLP